MREDKSYTDYSMSMYQVLFVYGRQQAAVITGRGWSARDAVMKACKVREEQLAAARSPMPRDEKVFVYIEEAPYLVKHFGVLKFTAPIVGTLFPYHDA